MLRSNLNRLLSFEFHVECLFFKIATIGTAPTIVVATIRGPNERERTDLANSVIAHEECNNSFGKIGEILRSTK